MKIIINLILVAIILGLIYWLAFSIYEPIQFMGEKVKREDAVVKQLKNVRKAQLAYRGIVGEYAHNFDTLKQVLTTDSFKIIKVFGNPDEEGGEVQYETIYVKAIDSVRTMGLNLDSLSYIPYTDNKEFEVLAQIIEYQSTEIPVVQVRAAYKDFMGQFAAARYKRYDRGYNPDDITEPKYYLRFGDLTRPSTAGNWEN